MTSTTTSVLSHLDLTLKMRFFSLLLSLRISRTSDVSKYLGKGFLYFLDSELSASCLPGCYTNIWVMPKSKGNFKN